MQQTREEWCKRLEAFAQICTDRQEALLVEQQEQLSSLHASLEQQVSQAVRDAAPSAHILQLHKLVSSYRQILITRDAASDTVFIFRLDLDCHAQPSNSTARLGNLEIDCCHIADVP